MQTFFEFIDKKQREGEKHLKIIKKLLESKGLKVIGHFDEEDPYIFMFSPSKNVSFDGIRIYQLGEQIAFRIQKEEKTEPFGRAYPLNIEEMFNDLMSDYHNPEDAGKKVVEAVTDEVNRFFTQSAEAERELRGGDLSFSNSAVLRYQSGDYSNTVFTRG